MVHVPYKGSAPAVTDLLGGQVQVFFGNVLSVIEQVRSGKLRGLAVTSLERMPVSPRSRRSPSRVSGFEAGTGSA
jgi:tripartite-type tricarboxylate transporter receptor subunit TctC